MVTKILITFCIVLSIAMTGCSTDTQAEKSLKSQQMWDDGDYEAIIESLESEPERTNDENLELGMAYMSAANLSSTDVTLMLYSSNNEALSPLRSTTNDNDAFAIFSKKIQDNVNKNPKVLAYLQNAIENFEVAKEGTDSNNTQEVDLLLGTAQTARAATVFSYLGDISKLLENGIDYELIASSCAIFHTYSAPNIELLSNPIDDCLESKILVDTNSKDSYRELLITLSNSQSYKRLITLDGKNVVLSDGYIDVDGNFTLASENGVNTPNPVEDESLTIQKALVVTLNEGFENLFYSVPDDLKDDLLYFRLEIDLDGDGVVTALELSDYINIQINKYI